MSVDEPMTVDERRKYLRRMQNRYQEASRRQRSQLLDEMHHVTGLHRKSLGRLMSGDLTRRPRRRHRGRSYGPEVCRAVGLIAESLDHVCAERLQPNLVWMATHLARHGELEISPTLLEQLDTISVSTVRRRLKDLHQDEPRLRRRRPALSPGLARSIPVRRIPWQEPHPGHFEVDLVHHSGVSASGQYVHTLQMVDVATGWSERVATLGRSYLVMRDAFRCIEARLPFPILEVHSDNDSAFLNHHLVRHWGDRVASIPLSRSRPYDKNDNRFVEQKNDTLVRAYLGYDRLDTVAQTELLNHLYEAMRVYYNFFQPVMRLKDKIIVSQAGRPTRVRRRFHPAQTPFDRLCASGALDGEVRCHLEALREATSPTRLREGIYATIDQLFTLPPARGTETEDVYQTLFFPITSQEHDPAQGTLSIERTIATQ
jgi:hypothetical protein